MRIVETCENWICDVCGGACDPVPYGDDQQFDYCNGCMIKVRKYAFKLQGRQFNRDFNKNGVCDLCDKKRDIVRDDEDGQFCSSCLIKLKEMFEGARKKGAR